LSVLPRLAKLGWRSRSKERAQASRAIEELRIKTHSQETIVRTLSGGNQQKVVFGRNMLREPRVLLLDEPTRGVDVGAKSEIYRLLAQLSAQGVTVLMASSELPELIGVCDRIAVLQEGLVVAEMTAAEATEESLLAAAGMETEPAMAGAPAKDRPGEQDQPGQQDEQGEPK
ncbi:MAG: ATP-binding cassette domain-containing protein, partial [Actinomycetaceae bacterium]